MLHFERYSVVEFCVIEFDAQTHTQPYITVSTKVKCLKAFL
jgi:hypothetical protein